MIEIQKAVLQRLPYNTLGSNPCISGHSNAKAQKQRPTELKLPQAKKAAAVCCTRWFGEPVLGALRGPSQGNMPMAFRLQDSTTSPLVRLFASSRRFNIPDFASTATVSVAALIGPASRQRRNDPSFVGA